ncbi:MAG: ATP-binding cassette domain-containing protein [Anaerolineae bacterium]|nr:ATP-binding cassette domain-containing protein [Anaerolineae bacterium]
MLVAATMFMDSNMIGISTPNLQIMPDRGTGYTAKLDGDVVNIGSKADRDITINAEGVAEFHTRLRRDGKSYRIYSLGGASAVLVNDKPISGSQLLTAGDRIRLQDAEGRGATLVFENPMETMGTGGNIGDTHLLLNLPFAIGRDPKSDLVIDSLTVSWNHAQIVAKGNQRQLMDMGSTNGSRVNGQLITQPTPLQSGDTIQISNFTYLYDGMQLRRISATPDIRLMAVQLEMTYQRFFPRSSHTTVRDVSLAFEPQEFIAIVGGSGSGKSTLLRMLNGVSHATGGHIYANGDDLYANYPTYQSVIGYVPQADIVHGELTVWQGLWFAAQLRFPNEQEEPRQQRISRALDLLELTPYKNNLIRNLSGGQRKRVSIALELMAEPPLLFLDEPGSGLDPGLDTTMMRTLRRMADRGHTVVIVTHTTLNLDLCDKLIVMSQGRLTFYGTPKEALKFFNVDSYAEIYNILLEPKNLVDMTQTYAADIGAIRSKAGAIAAADAADQWRDSFKGSAYYQKHVVDRLKSFTTKAADKETLYLNKQLQRSKRGGFWQQVRVLSQRTFALLRRDVVTLLLLLIILPLIGVFLATISRDTLISKSGEELLTQSTMFIPAKDRKDLVTTLFDKWPTSVLPCASDLPLPDKERDSDGDPCPLYKTRGGGVTKAGTPATEYRIHAHEVGTYAPAQNAQRLIFMMTLAVALLGIFAAASTIVTERTLFFRERLINVRISSYLASKLIIYGGLALISSVMLLLLVAFGVQYPSQGLIMWGPLEMFITLALTAFAGISIGICISALNKSTNAALALAFGVLIAQILFSGALFEMNGFVGSVLSRLTVTRWAIESMGSTVHLPQQDTLNTTILRTQMYRLDAGKDPIKLTQPGLEWLPGSRTLKLDYPTEAGGLILKWVGLLGFSVVFVGIAYLALRRQESF